MKECTREEKRPALRYNFVFFFARDDYWKAILGEELYECENVHVYEEAFDGSPFLKKLFHYHWAYSVNRKLRLPFKRIWFRRMYRQSFRNDLPLCFVYLGGNNIRFDGGFCKYVRKQSPDNRQVVLHQDLISKKLDYDYEEVRSKVDLCTTYDKAEAEHYGIHYFQELTFSKLIPIPENVEFQQDVYFLGAVKDRLEKLIAVYKKLQNAGLICKFMIAGVPKEQQIQGDGISYITNIPYSENLKNVLHSRCILELAQGGSADSTVRAREAIAYGRKLLTDCQSTNPEFFHQGQLQVFSDPDAIDLSSLRDDYDPNCFPAKIDQSPILRLIDIQTQLEEKNREENLSHCPSI